MTNADHIAKVMKRVEKMPDELVFVDWDTGEPIEDFDTVILDDKIKFGLASMCIAQKQSLETVVTRIIKWYLKELNV